MDEDKRARLEALRKKKRLAELRAKRDGAKSTAKKEEEEAPDVSMGASALEGAKQGLTFGFADEMQAGFGNFLDNITGLNDDMADLGFEPAEDGYRSLRDNYRDDVEAAREANPKAFLAGEVAGSLLIPGGSGAAAAKAASKGSRGLAKAVRKMEPGSFGRAMARGATEGALYGAGNAAELEDVPRDAVFGAGSAAAFGAGLRGLGKVGQVASNRRIKERLQKQDGSFTPMNIIDPEGRLGDAYRNMVGRSFGGKQAIQAQEKPFIEAAQGAYDAAKGARRSLSREAKARRGKVGDDVLAVEKDAFFQQALKATPENAPKGLIDRAYFQKGKPQALLKSLNKYWKKDAFKQVKKKTFDIDDDLLRILKKEFPEDDVMESLGNRKTVSGDVLLDLRNRYAMDANRGAGASGKAAMTAGKARQYSNTVGEWMKARMSKEDAALFDDELQAYGDWVALKKAGKASDKGRFNVRALGKADKSDKRLVGEGYGQAIGEGAEDQLKKLKGTQTLRDFDASAAAQDAVDAAKAEGRDLSRSLTAANPSGLSETLTTKMMAPGITNDLGALVMGAGIGRGLATKGAQKALAGQTQWQKRMRALGRDERARLMAEALRRLGTMESAYGATGE